MYYDGNFNSKLPNTGTTIFSVMSKLAKDFNAINLSQGFPDFPCDDKLIELVSKHMKAGNNQYAAMAGAEKLRNELAKKTKKLYGAEYDPETEITVTAGATQGLQVAITALLNEDDEVIIFEPAYDSYVPCILLNKAKPIYYKMSAPEYTIDWKHVVKLITQRTKMIIINTPHNPTGSVLNETDFKMLEKILAGTDIVLLSDEVYEHIIFDENEHQSVSKYPELSNRAIIVSSFGKTFHTTGWKMGYVLAPSNLMHEFRKVFQFSQFSVSTPMQMAIADYLEDEKTYMELSAFYQQKRDVFRGFISESKFKLLHCSGTYFQCVDYSAISDKGDVAFAEELTKEHGVAAIPISSFYKNNDDQKIIRFCFAKGEETLKQAGNILCKI